MVVTNVLGQPQVVELRGAGVGAGVRAGTKPGLPSGLSPPRITTATPPPPVPSRLPAPLGPCPPGFFRPRTSGSPVSWLVWMRIVPMRTSLHTARSAGSIVSPARRMDTPVIWGPGGGGR